MSRTVGMAGLGAEIETVGGIAHGAARIPAPRTGNPLGDGWSLKGSRERP
jgi:hypothetical protein